MTIIRGIQYVNQTIQSETAVQFKVESGQWLNYNEAAFDVV